MTIAAIKGDVMRQAIGFTVCPAPGQRQNRGLSNEVCGRGTSRSPCAKGCTLAGSDLAFREVCRGRLVWANWKTCLEVVFPPLFGRAK